jgi:hypothetical protein
VRSTGSAPPFHEPERPNRNEGENENPSARCERRCNTCLHDILAMVADRMCSCATGVSLWLRLRVCWRPNGCPFGGRWTSKFLGRERYRTLSHRKGAAGVPVMPPACAGGGQESRPIFHKARDNVAAAVGTFRRVVSCGAPVARSNMPQLGHPLGYARIVQAPFAAGRTARRRAAGMPSCAGPGTHNRYRPFAVETRQCNPASAARLSKYIERR